MQKEDNLIIFATVFYIILQVIKITVFSIQEMAFTKKQRTTTPYLQFVWLVS